MMMRAFSGVLVAMVCASCQQDAPRLRGNEVLHPTPENAPPPDAAVLGLTVTAMEWDRGAMTAWNDARERLVGASVVLAIGDNREGPANFARIVDVAITPGREVLVLDGGAQEVRVFDFDGRHLQTFGGIGDGPTEFRRASSIELIGDGTLIVSSQGSKQFKAFQKPDTGWDLDRIGELPVVTTDMCATSDARLFLAGFTEDRNVLVHELVDDGVATSFVEGYRADHWFLRYYMSKGLVACLETPTRVVFAYELMPTVRLFRPGGDTPLWTGYIEDFMQPPIIQRTGNDGRHGMRRGSPTVEDGVASLHGILPGYVLLQVGRFNTKGRTLEVRSYLIDADSGAGAYVDDSMIPPVLSVFPEGFVAMFEDPYPRLEVRTY